MISIKLARAKERRGTMNENSKPKDVDSYIVNSGREARPKLEEMLKFRVQIQTLSEPRNALTP